MRTPGRGDGKSHVNIRGQEWIKNKQGLKHGCTFHFTASWESRASLDDIDRDKNTWTWLIFRESVLVTNVFAASGFTVDKKVVECCGKHIPEHQFRKFYFRSDDSIMWQGVKSGTFMERVLHKRCSAWESSKTQFYWRLFHNTRPGPSSNSDCLRMISFRLFWSQQWRHSAAKTRFKNKTSETPTLSFSGGTGIIGSDGTAVCTSARMMQPGFYSQVGATMKGSDSRWQTSSADSSESDRGRRGGRGLTRVTALSGRDGERTPQFTARTPPSTLSLIWNERTRHAGKLRCGRKHQHD